MVEVTNLEVTKGIEIGSVLYLHPSDNPGAPLVPVVFDGIGYRTWKRGMIRSLSVKNKLGSINGDSKKPLPTDPNYKQWERCDNMVTSWILNSLSRDIADSVAYVDSALELWTDLEDRYDQTNGAKLYQIQKEINDLIQGVMDVTAYYTKMKKLREELSGLCIKTHCNCICSCGAKDMMHKVEQDRRLIQFPMGLNEVYKTIRGNILMMNQMPSVAQAFALLIQEEKQREFKTNNQFFAETSSLVATSSSTSSTSGNQKGQNFQTNYSSTSSNHRGRPYCEHCRRPGHFKAKCYQLHGYPQNNNRPQRSQSNGQQGYNQFQRQQQYENPSSNKP